ncbi:hypothetical protein HJFPF1_11071 [Paramyrothecium foliicola]|nr:hypothetical protein HJFPF1_11071 [Paramyrothecium foliicola]
MLIESPKSLARGIPGAVERKEFGLGQAVIDSVTGAILQFVDPQDHQRRFLFDTEHYGRHSVVEHNWGSGHVVTDRGSGRWNAHSPMTRNGDNNAATFAPTNQLSLEVVRKFGALLEETYTFVNRSDQPLTITSLGIQTPFADVYNGARRALAEAVHTHVFCGGSWSWVLAQPMSGEGSVLGLRLTEGVLWGYSIETRNAAASSNIRGHIVLHVTDLARNPTAFGGQPRIALRAGESYTLRWELAFYQSTAEFLTATKAPAIFSSYSASSHGGFISVSSPHAVPKSTSPLVRVTPSPEGYRITATEHGIYPIEIGNSRTEVQFHMSLQEAVQLRAQYIMRYQRAADRPGLLRHAFVPVDTMTLLTQTTNGWPDWTDGSERIAMPVLLQLASMRGWVDENLVGATLKGWADFAKQHLLDPEFTPSRGSQLGVKTARLYDVPWLCQFFHDRYIWKQDASYLDLSAGLLKRAFEYGLSDFLAIHLSEVTRAVIKSLEDAGKTEQSIKLTRLLVASARDFVHRGRNLPGHELSYEQSIVAPLLSLFIDAYSLSGDEIFVEQLRKALPWLLAFGGPQPHVRLHGIAIRHWDGYWFGQERQWGDVFPHYWSVLTSSVLLRLPSVLRTKETDSLAMEILKANMLNYNSDGSATCAFVMPTAVDGRAAHSSDPLANDQDWHLVMWMRLIDEGVIDRD